VHYFVLILLSSLLIIITGAWTWAEIITIGPQKEIQRWEQQCLIDDHDLFNIAWERYITANRINPVQADFLSGLGRLSLIKCCSSRQGNDVADNQHCTQAITYLQRALTKRPSSGLTWAYLANALSYDPNQSELFIIAMARSASFEPYERLNQMQLIPLAIKHWKQLPNSLKHNMMTIIKHGLRYQPLDGSFIIEAAVKHNWSEPLKPLLLKKRQTRYWMKLSNSSGNASTNQNNSSSPKK
jgi:hypothetical protein